MAPDRRRDTWSRRIAALDPEADASEIYRITATHEFPWDMNQSLGFALFRTYAVPSIGAHLGVTGEFTERTQKRYDDTSLLLDAMVEHGFDDPIGRAAIRRMNQMHRTHGIGVDDLRYVLATFVVVPGRWMADFGWRPMSPAELTASANHYQALGRRMGITDIPETYHAFAAHLDAYESAHFGYSDGGRAVADATLDLQATFAPFAYLPRAVHRRTAYALMDEPLLSALHYPVPGRSERAAVRGAMVARAAAERRLPPRTEPRYARQLPSIRSYPEGYRVEQLGTFGGCPVDHLTRPTA